MADEQKSVDTNRPKRTFRLIWCDEVEYFRSIKSTDLKVYLVYRLTADTRNNLSSLQLPKIKELSGLSHSTLVRSRKRLIARGLILPCGYKLTAVGKFEVKNDTKSKTFEVKNDTKSKTFEVKNDTKKCNLRSKMTPPIYKIDKIDSVIDRQTLSCLQEFYKTQNQNFEPQEKWALKIVRERLVNGFKPGEIRALLKRHTGQKIMIHKALSIENLNSLRTQILRSRENTEFEEKLKKWKQQPKFKGSKVTA